jgi:hypothetical protein
MAHKQASAPLEMSCLVLQQHRLLEGRNMWHSATIATDMKPGTRGLPVRVAINNKSKLGKDNSLVERTSTRLDHDHLNRLDATRHGVREISARAKAHYNRQGRVQKLKAGLQRNVLHACQGSVSPMPPSQQGRRVMGATAEWPRTGGVCGLRSAELRDVDYACTRVCRLKHSQIGSASIRSD